MMRTLSVPLLLLLGCTDLPPVARGVCGNAVLETGELCDTFTDHAGESGCGAPDSAHACAFVCDAAECPPGWSCGSDDLCRLPDARFDPVPGLWSFRSIDATIADADGDGLPDLIGNDRSRFSVLFQTAPRRFDQDFLLETRIPIGAPYFGDLDGDARADVVVPTILGLLVLLEQDDRTLLSRVYDTTIGIAGGPALRFIVTGERDSPLTENDVAIAVGNALTSIDADAGVLTVMPPWLDGRDLPARIPFGRIPATDTRSTFALWNEGGRQIALYRIEGSTRRDRRPALRLTVSVPDPLGSTIALTDADGDGVLDLLAAVGHPESPVAVALGTTSSVTGDLGFAPFCDLRFELLDVPTNRWLPVDAPLLGAGDFDGDGLADYVFDVGVLTSNGVAPTCGTPIRTARLSAVTLFQRWKEVETGDFNGDGRLDFAAASDERQLDVYFGSGTGGFARRTVLLDRAPTLLRAGDFDGDFVDDIAFVGDEPSGALLSVIFGDAGSELSEPRAIGRFPAITDVVTAQWAFDLEALDVVSDLLITSHGVDSPDTSVAIAFGSTSRQMFAPYVFPGSDTGVPVAAIVGDFCNCEVPGCVEQKDLAAISRTTIPPKTELWIARGVAGDPPGRLDPLEAAIDIPLGTASRFDLTCSIWAVADVDGDGRDEIFGLDNIGARCADASQGPSRMLVIDPDATACGGAFSAEARTIEEDQYTGATRIRPRDLDADGDLDLLLTFAGRERAGAGVVILWNDGGRIGDRVTTVEAPAGTTPVDTDALQLDTDPELELVLRTSDESGRSSVWFIDDGEPQLFQKIMAAPGAVTAGDLDLDGLDDIVLTFGARASVYWGQDGALR